MSKTKWYQRPVYLTVALALVISLGNLAVPMAGTVEASPDDWYVDGASGTDDGTHGTGPGVEAFKTIQYAINDSRVGAGDTVNVAAGTYHESAYAWVDIDITKSLSLIGAGSSQTIVELNQYDNPPGSHMDGALISASDVLIQGIKFTRKPAAPYACGFNIRSFGPYNNITLRDVESEYSHGMNVCFGGSGSFQNVTLEDCNIHHGGERNFYETPGTTIEVLTVTNCHFDNSGQKADWGNYPATFDPVGFNLQGTTTDLTIIGGTFNNNPSGGLGFERTTNAIIEDVVVENSGTYSWDRCGIAVWDGRGSSSNIQIINPTVTGCGGQGILFGTWGQSVSNASVIGGTISGSNGHGVMVYAGGAGGSVQGITLDGVTVTSSGSHNVEICEDDSSGDATVSDVIVRGCTITNATSVGVDFVGVTNLAGSRVYCNNIVGNGKTDTGVRNSGGGTLDAENNWWGHASGPSGEGAGSGDAVSTNVDYDPWLSMEFQYCEECGGTPPSPPPTPSPPEPTPPGAVGGEAYPVNKVALAAPWLALAALLIPGAVLLIRRRVPER